MAFIHHCSLCCAWRVSNQLMKGPIFTIIRHKEYRRKPLWMRTAKSKLFRIPQHPYFPPEEKELIAKLEDEYYIKINSTRKLFQEEMKQKFEDEGNTLKKQEESKNEFLMLLEENRKENEYIKSIREETLERLFQAKHVELLELEENRKAEQEKIKLKVEEIVRKEKEKAASFINYENLESAIEKAMDNPINYNFAINVNGSLKWEGKPPLPFEEEMKRRIAESITENCA